MERIALGRKLVFQEDVRRAAQVLDAQVQGALGPVHCAAVDAVHFRATFDVNGRSVSVVLPNVHDGVSADLIAWMCRALEAAGRTERVSFEAGRDPFDLGLWVEATDDYAGWVVPDGDGWRVLAAPPADPGPLTERARALTRGEVTGAVRRWWGGGSALMDAAAVSQMVFERRQRLEIRGLGTFHPERTPVVDEAGQLFAADAWSFHPSRSLRAAMRGGEPSEIAVGGENVASWRAEAASIEAWATAIRDLLLATGQCAAPPLGVLFIEDRPILAWTDPATGRTAIAEPSLAVRFSGDCVSAPLIAAPGVPLPR